MCEYWKEGGYKGRDEENIMNLKNGTRVVKA